MISRWVKFRKGTMYLADAGVFEYNVQVRRLVSTEFNDRVSPVFKSRAEMFKNRIKAGHLCFGIVYSERVVCYLWVTQSANVPLCMGIPFKVPDGCAYIWDCKTDLEFRNRGLYACALKALRGNGIIPTERFYIAGEAGNPAALKAIANAGFTESQFTYWVLRIGPVRIYKIGKEPAKITTKSVVA